MIQLIFSLNLIDSYQNRWGPSKVTFSPMSKEDMKWRSNYKCFLPSVDQMVGCVRNPWDGRNCGKCFLTRSEMVLAGPLLFRWSLLLGGKQVSPKTEPTWGALDLCGKERNPWERRDISTGPFRRPMVSWKRLIVEPSKSSLTISFWVYRRLSR